MKSHTDWLEIEINGDRYRIAARASNAKDTQGKVIVEKFIGDEAKNWGWSHRVGWNGILNLFDKLPNKWEV